MVREHWSSKVGFILAAIGSTIGLGLLWKFPYVVGQNGGGAFLLAYFISILVIGVPMFIGEILMGRHAQRAAVGSFEVALGGRESSWGLGGYLGVLASFLIMSFYSVIAGWGLSYILMSLSGFMNTHTPDQINVAFEKLRGSASITMLWHFVFTGITMAIVMSGVREGIEYWSKIMVRILLVLLVLLFLFALTLPGFQKAFTFIFLPDWSSFKFSSLIEAVGLAFMTMSLGQGVMISYGSYLKKEESLVQMALIVAVCVIVAALLCALMIFPVIFSFHLPPDSGPSLVFKTLPYLFSQLPGTLILSTLFFFLFVFTALTSAVPLVEVVATNIMERYNIKRKNSVMWVSLATFVFGIPSAMAASGLLFPQWQSIFGLDFLETINQLVSIWIIPIAVLITAIFIGFVMDRQTLKEELSSDLVRYSGLFSLWLFFVRFVVPVLIILVILQKSGVFSFEGRV
jgi:neurotransmitter:Na+ symporter, NSS family